MMLKATKTSLYNLCLRFWPDMPKMSQCQYQKLYRKRSWWLKFRRDGHQHTVYLSTSIGKAFIDDTWMDDDWEQVRNPTPYTLSIEELRELGMIDET